MTQQNGCHREVLYMGIYFGPRNLAVLVRRPTFTVTIIHSWFHCNHLNGY